MQCIVWLLYGSESVSRPGLGLSWLDYGGCRFSASWMLTLPPVLRGPDEGAPFSRAFILNLIHSLSPRSLSVLSVEVLYESFQRLAFGP